MREKTAKKKKKAKALKKILTMMATLKISRVITRQQHQRPTMQDLKLLVTRRRALATGLLQQLHRWLMARNTSILWTTLLTLTLMLCS
jgi:hypothetical protein